MSRFSADALAVARLPSWVPCCELPLAICAICCAMAACAWALVIPAGAGVPSSLRAVDCAWPVTMLVQAGSWMVLHWLEAMEQVLSWWITAWMASSSSVVPDRRSLYAFCAVVKPLRTMPMAFAIGMSACTALEVACAMSVRELLTDGSQAAVTPEAVLACDCRLSNDVTLVTVAPRFCRDVCSCSSWPLTWFCCWATPTTEDVTFASACCAALSALLTACCACCRAACAAAATCWAACWAACCAAA